MLHQMDAFNKYSLFRTDEWLAARESFLREYTIRAHDITIELMIKQKRDHTSTALKIPLNI